MNSREIMRSAAEQAMSEAIIGPEFEKMAANVWREMMDERTAAIMRDMYTKPGFECENCGRRFTDGIEAGNHEIEFAHRTSHANIPVQPQGVGRPDGYGGELTDGGY